MRESVHRESLDVGGAKREFALARPSQHDFAMVEELSFVRREAQAEANEAYEDWRARLDDESWTIYLAARDRADAAEDELASWVKQLAA